MLNARLIGYIDVYQEENGSYVVNDQMVIAELVFLESLEDNHLLETAAKQKVISGSHLDRFGVEEYGFGIYEVINKIDGRPVCCFTLYD